MVPEIDSLNTISTLDIGLFGGYKHVWNQAMHNGQLAMVGETQQACYSRCLNCNRKWMSSPLSRVILDLQGLSSLISNSATTESGGPAQTCWKKRNEKKMCMAMDGNTSSWAQAHVFPRVLVCCHQTRSTTSEKCLEKKVDKE